MKYLLRICTGFILLILSFTGLRSQSLEFAILPETKINSHPDSSEIKSFAEVRNKTNNPIRLKAKMTMINLVSGHKVYFCLRNCFPPKTDDFEMPDNSAVTLAPGESTIGDNFFDVVLVPNKIEGCTTVKMTFMVVGNPSDNVEYTVTFCSTTPVIETELEAFNFGEPSPIPATDFVNFNYDMAEGINPGEIEIYDNLGNQVNTINLTDRKFVKYNTALLPSGTYYAIINAGDKKKAVRKFVVSH
ncbi:MAG: T9SS type A sorting domain-containing protein [Ignavibacteriae bacterium]|nr:T9SS type A sorting domain-containing protein [Ignavibacteriota bacterium]